MRFAVIALVAMLFLSFAGAETLMPVIDEWTKIVEASAEAKKIGDFEVVGSGYIKDAGLLMLRAGDRYYLAQIKDNKVVGVNEQPITWKTWEDTIREYPGLEDAEIMSSWPNNSEFISLVVSSGGNEYLITIDGDKIADIDPVDVDRWIETAMKDKVIKGALEGKRYNVTWHLLPTLDGKNSIAMRLQISNSETYVLSIDDLGGDEVFLFFDANENLPEGYIEHRESVDPMEVAMNDPEVRALMEGKEYAFGSPMYFSSSSSGIFSGHSISVNHEISNEGDLDKNSVAGFSSKIHVTRIKGAGNEIESEDYESISYMGISGCGIPLNVEGKLYTIMVVLWDGGPKRDVSVIDQEKEYLEYYTPVLKNYLSDDGVIVGSLTASIGYEPMFFIYAKEGHEIYSVATSNGKIESIERIDLAGKQSLLERITERIREACF
jgi:hypothetical protein